MLKQGNETAWSLQVNRLRGTDQALVSAEALSRQREAELGSVSATLEAALREKQELQSRLDRCVDSGSRSGNDVHACSADLQRRGLRDLEGIQEEQRVKQEQSKAELRGAVEALDMLMAVSARMHPEKVSVALVTYIKSVTLFSRR